MCEGISFNAFVSFNNSKMYAMEMVTNVEKFDTFRNEFSRMRKKKIWIYLEWFTKQKPELPVFSRQEILKRKKEVSVTDHIDYILQ